MNADNLLGPIQVTSKTGDEKFLAFSGDTIPTVLDFWQWSTSDLLSNATRGRLGEYLVATALDIHHGVRNEWDAYDLETPEGVKIEVKTSAFLQSWFQKKLSTISYGIAPSKKWSYETNEWEDIRVRQGDYYIFCLLHHKDKKTVDPLNLDQWTFYILPTKVLNEEKPNQKTITLGSLLKLDPIECVYGQIKSELQKLI